MALDRCPVEDNRELQFLGPEQGHQVSDIAELHPIIELHLFAQYSLALATAMREVVLLYGTLNGRLRRLNAF